MVSITTWATHYHRNKRNGSTTQRSFETSPKVWDLVSLGHVNRQAFVSTLSTLPSATFLLVPGEEGEAQLLHHGFLHASEIGGISHAVFIHGNLSESPFKELPIAEIITPLSNPPSRTRQDPFLRCPSLTAMCAVESAEAFADLPAGNNEILHGRPNHFFISGMHFVDMNGQRSFPAANLAFRIINSML
jgi:hypothetical protein